jgi:hypothetical protein
MWGLPGGKTSLTMSSPANDAPACSGAERAAPGACLCLAAGCGKPLTGRQARACSDRHRAALSRQERAARLADRQAESRMMLEEALALNAATRFAMETVLRRLIP